MYVCTYLYINTKNSLSLPYTHTHTYTHKKTHKNAGIKKNPNIMKIPGCAGCNRNKIVFQKRWML